MEKIYARPKSFSEKAEIGYCPGCFYSTIGKLICQVVDELGIQDDVSYVQGVGCGALCVNFMDFDSIGAAHGRACAVAGALKLCSPETIVFTYQGDGDLASIGLAETLSAANRGDNISVFFVNNATYGMTGGQMAPTTLIGMKASTAPMGRDPAHHGYPMHMCEIINTLKAPSYIARVACIDPANIRKARAAIKKSLEYQIAGKGFSIVEFISNCPTAWGISPMESIDFIRDKMLAEFPLGEFRAV
ncbi:MAG: thiamine pyrophosphate-dependent enzyme [Oscillospiraceae bacterium]|nr:thiamine pyrophosphate-dependent enzyme [Oscillospiraceae bacterium]